MLLTCARHRTMELLSGKYVMPRNKGVEGDDGAIKDVVNYSIIKSGARGVVCVRQKKPPAQEEVVK